MDTTTALFNSATTDPTQSNFAAVAKAFGCEGRDAVECMRNVSSQDIERHLYYHQDLQFTPIPDKRIVFANYTERYEIGAFSSIPAIIGTNQYELNALNTGKPQEALVKAGNASFLCGAATASQFRKEHGRTTYRFLYEGNFTNVSPPGFEGAYHASELPLIMGTAGLFHGESTEYEELVGREMQDLWLAFAKDSSEGLRKAGLGAFEEGKAVVLGGEETAMREIGIDELDGVCSELGL